MTNSDSPYPVQLFSKAAFTKVTQKPSSDIEINGQHQSIVNIQTEAKDATNQDQMFGSNRLIKSEVTGIVNFLYSDFQDNQAINDDNKKEYKSMHTYLYCPKEIKDETSTKNVSNIGHLSSPVGLNILSENRRNVTGHQLSEKHITSASSCMMIDSGIQSQNTSLPAKLESETVSNVSGNLPSKSILDIPDDSTNKSKVRQLMILSSQFVTVTQPSLLSFGHRRHNVQLITPGKYLVNPKLGSFIKVSEPSATIYTTASIESDQKSTSTGVMQSNIPCYATTGIATFLTKTSQSSNMKTCTTTQTSSSQTPLVFAGKPFNLPMNKPKKQFSVSDRSVTSSATVAVMPSVTVTSSTTVKSSDTVSTSATCTTESCKESVNTILTNVESENQNPSPPPSNKLLDDIPESVVSQSSTQSKRICNSGILDSPASKCCINQSVEYNATSTTCGTQQKDSVSKIDKPNSKREMNYNDAITKNEKSNLVPIENANIQMISRELSRGKVISDQDSLKILVSQNEKSGLEITSVFTMANARNIFENGEKSIQSFLDKKAYHAHSPVGQTNTMNNLNTRIRKKLKRHLLQSNNKVKPQKDFVPLFSNSRNEKTNSEPQSFVCDLDKTNPSCLFFKLPSYVVMDRKLQQRPFVVVERLMFSRYNRLLSSSFACNKVCRQNFVRNLHKKKNIQRKLTIFVSNDNNKSSGLSKEENVSPSSSGNPLTPNSIQHLNSDQTANVSKVSNVSGLFMAKGIPSTQGVTFPVRCRVTTTNLDISATKNPANSSMVKTLTTGPQFVKSPTVSSNSNTLSSNKNDPNVKVITCSLASILPEKKYRDVAPNYFLATLNKIDSSNKKGMTSVSIKIPPVQIQEQNNYCRNVTSTCADKTQKQFSANKTVPPLPAERTTQSSSFTTLQSNTLTSVQPPGSIGKEIFLSLTKTSTGYTAPIKGGKRSVQLPISALTTSAYSGQSSSFVGKSFPIILNQLQTNRTMLPLTRERSGQHSDLTMRSTNKQNPAQSLSTGILPSKYSTVCKSEDISHKHLAQTRPVYSATQFSPQQVTFSQRNIQNRPLVKYGINTSDSQNPMKLIPVFSVVESEVNKGIKYFFTNDGIRIKTEPVILYEASESEPLPAVNRSSIIESRRVPEKIINKKEIGNKKRSSLSTSTHTSVQESSSGTKTPCTPNANNLIYTNSTQSVYSANQSSSQVASLERNSTNEPAPKTKIYVKDSNGKRTPVSSVVKSKVNKGTKYYFIPDEVRIKSEPVPPEEIVEVTNESEPSITEVKTLETVESQPILRKTENMIGSRKRTREDDDVVVRKRTRGNEIVETEKESNQMKTINWRQVFKPSRIKLVPHATYGKTSDFVQKERLKNLRDFVQMKIRKGDQELQT